MKSIVIFGTSEIAELAHFYFSSDSDYQVVAFTVDRDWLSVETLCGLPVVAFEDLSSLFPPQKYQLFIALSYSGLNRLRFDKYRVAKTIGYRLPSYISSKATVLNYGRIGDNCFILEDNTIQPFVTIGNNVTLWSGNHIGHHSQIGDHTFISSHVVVSGGVCVGESCFIGVNATLRDHINIGHHSVIGAGALVLEDVDPEGVYLGPATERSRVPSSRLRRI